MILWLYICQYIRNNQVEYLDESIYFAHDKNKDFPWMSKVSSKVMCFSVYYFI